MLKNNYIIFFFNQNKVTKVIILIAIIDFHGQYVYLIANRLNELGVKNISVKTYDELKKVNNLKGIILSGGPYSVYEKGAKTIDKRIFDLDVPILGICYGHQLIAYLLGGEVGRGTPEFGFSIFRPRQDILFKGLDKEEIVWMSHCDEVFSIPPSGEALGSTDLCRIAAYKVGDNIYGVQFHPEVSHTLKGNVILRNFAFKICKEAKRGWDVKSFINKTIEHLRENINGVAILGFSGGVDSTTCAALARKAGIDAHIIFVDHGFMRKEDKLGKIFKMFDVKYIDASDMFFDAVKDVLDPDERRRIIGKLFIDIFEEEAKSVGAKYLIQGTIAPDVIESTRGDDSKGSGFIKIHHNVGGLPEKLNLKIIEPLRPLFKYQIRLLAKALGLPDYIVKRQPFPGPGLAVRIVGRITKSKVDILREITHVTSTFLSKYGYSQYFAAMIPIIGHHVSDGFVFEVGSIGVKGDSRVLANILSVDIDWDSLSYYDLLKLQSRLTSKYENITRVIAKVIGNYIKGKDAIVIRVVTTEDFMTATPANVPITELRKIARYALRFNSIKYVGYEITTKPPSTIELI